MKKNISLKLIMIGIILIFPIFLLVPKVKAATCSATASDGLCYGRSNDAACSTVLMPDCNSFPSCLYSGVIGGYYCKNHCYNTGQSGTCGTGSVCLCVDSNPCPLCTSNGKNLSQCSDSGCGGSDSTPPTIAIISPTSNATYSTTVSPFALSGTAADNTTVTEVTWSNNRNNGFIGGSGTATGTTSWSIGYVNLESGQNVITVTAKDGYGNTGTDTITVTYTPPSSSSYPVITESEDATNYNISISDPNSLTEVAYAWGARPNVYFLVPFANNSTPQLSAAEQSHYQVLAANFSTAWDNLTAHKHPLNFYFLQPFVVSNYSTSENNWNSYISKSISQFESQNAGILSYPAIYVIIYPEPYFSSGTFIDMFGSSDKHVLAEVFFDLLNDGSNINSYTHPDEIISNVMLHELTHNFAHLPNNDNFPPGTNKYFWLSHPAGFYGSGGSCGNETDVVDCPPYAATESPTGTEGYFEAYSIISLRRAFISKQNIQNHDPELSPLVEMAMGIRSRYEDAPFMYYESYVTQSGSDNIFHLTATHDYGISSRWLFDYDSIDSAPNTLYWNLHYDVSKTILSNSTRNFSVAKSGQTNRSLLIFAADSNYPGYFKVFGTNARSSTVSYLPADVTPPAAPSGLAVN